jgi:hypothetical protein
MEEALMRQMSRIVIRGVLAGSIVLMLAMPAHAKPRESGRWFERRLDPIVKVIRKLVMRTLGDGLTDPRP